MLGKEGGLKSFEQVIITAKNQPMVAHRHAIDVGRCSLMVMSTLCAGERNPAAPGDVHGAERLADADAEGQAL